ncbi:MAG: UDP-N-acetylmuramoyl-tripeptide--D-alanyl-D-alanine ligase [Alistipes sp.]|nr:UDP-N-acetylmuramoyl-tripeptide--D-alanyl-D-alanine ligase [Alistipes sp.]
MSELYDLFTEHPRISTDSRRIEPDSIFFALHGANFDGNRFARAALELGAAAAVVNDRELYDSSPELHGRLFLVDDTLTALQNLAREHRNALAIPIIGIVGSNGKTTTKELVAAVLAEKYEIYATRGNLNNHIGVPLTLLSMTHDTELGIVEMGASACGEIALLSSVAQPNYGIVTNIGRSHLEGFGGTEGIRRGKGELFDFLDAHGGRAFVRQDDQTLVGMAVERDAMAVEYYPASLADGFRSRLAGDYNRFNIAAAVAIGRYFGVDEERMRSAIADYEPTNNRSQRVVTQRNTLIVDCYNANPTSMEASLRNFLAEPLASRSHRVAILGDMLELGEWSEQEHRAIATLAADSAECETIFVGDLFAAIAGDYPDSRFFASRAELEHYLAEHPVGDSLVLVKGSHGIGLDKLLPIL